MYFASRFLALFFYIFIYTTLHTVLICFPDPAKDVSYRTRDGSLFRRSAETLGQVVRELNEYVFVAMSVRMKIIVDLWARMIDERR